MTCHSLLGCDLQRDRGQIGAGFIRMTGVMLPSSWVLKLFLRAQGAGWDPMGPLRARLWLMPREHHGG